MVWLLIKVLAKIFLLLVFIQGTLLFLVRAMG